MQTGKRAHARTWWDMMSAWGTIILLVICVIVMLALPASPRKYPERIPIRFWHMWTAEWKDVVEKVVDRFNESQDRYEVIPLSVPGVSADSKFLLAVAGGDPPDVMAQWNQVIPKWAESGLIVPVNELMAPSEWEAFRHTAYPAALKIGMYEDNLYGVAIGLDLYACFCRLDHLREAGLSTKKFPDTLEELVQWGETLHKFNSNGSLARIGFLPLDMFGYAPVFGKGFYDWNQQLVRLCAEDNLKALNFLVEERQKLGFKNVLRYESGLGNLYASGIQWPFISGAYSIVVDGQWRVEQLAKYAPDLAYATFPVPAPKGGNKLAGWANGNFMVIPKGAKQIDGAWEFIKFWSGIENPERAAEFYTWGGWLPLSPAIANAPAYQEFVKKNPQFQTFLDLLPSENIVPTPPVPYQTYLSDRIKAAEDAALRGTLTPEQAFDRLGIEIQRELKSRREFGYTDKPILGANS